MKQSFGPWATAIGTDNYPRLSTFWKRRLGMLKGLSHTGWVLSRKTILVLIVGGCFVGLLPTVHGSFKVPNDLEPAVAEKPVDAQNLAEAEAVYIKLTQVTHWKEASKLSKKLATLGDVAVPFLLKGIEHDNKETRWWSFNRLHQEFPKEPRCVDLMIRLLKDKKNTGKNAKLRYSSVFLLGSWKIKRAREILWDIYKNDPDYQLYAAKSLAELGEKKVILMLYRNLGHDRYMKRFPANIGMKALSGKDLNDLDLEYKWDEGAFVSGGLEAIGRTKPIADSELKAKRFQAIAEYCKWLKKERPDLYQELDGTF